MILLPYSIGIHVTEWMTVQANIYQLLPITVVVQIDQSVVCDFVCVWTITLDL